MKFSLRTVYLQRSFSAFIVVGAIALAGCGKDAPPVPTVGETLPVSGRVTLNGKSLPGGMVILRPDKNKGNNSALAPAGEIQPDGSYSLKSVDKPGAPAGWYKITVINGIASGTQAVSIPQRYASETDTPLAVEVVANPAAGVYDLKLTK